MTCLFVPPYLLRRIAESGHPGAGCSTHTLRVDAGVRGRRVARLGAPPELDSAWVVHPADNGTVLPGRPVRSAGQPPSGDAAVDEAADGIVATLALFAEEFGRSSYDGEGGGVSLTVHYEKDYDNAFWDGAHLVFGDGDGRVFGRFTRAIDVLAHEFAHAVTERTAALAYQGQAGALNESVSDVFASCLKQRVCGQTVDEADWLIGEELFLPGVQARALRDMAAPGTAYDDPVLGHDPQVAHMDDFIDTTDDNGGVHLNSGIPNRAFHLAATAIGGQAWKGAGQVWYAALTFGTVATGAGFVSFAGATVEAAGDHAEVVRQAWRQVGVDPDGPPLTAGATARAAVPAGVVAVRRSGGFAGRTTSGTVDLDGPDPRAPRVRELVTGLDLRSVAPALPKPDMFTYTFEICGADPVAVPEQHLTDRLHRLAELVLSEGGESPAR
ncbi:protealysin inhibitor emfourin [Nocardioides sp. LHG3406-4]|uniref:protealysin inhibitor emfourin n=1 Tax=Nocardioides sp. LHG3406-4 TaxID=2804575 RepID=UPI003CF8B51A